MEEEFVEKFTVGGVICEVWRKKGGLIMCKVSCVLPMQSCLFLEIFSNSFLQCLLILNICILLLRLLMYLLTLHVVQSYFESFSADLTIMWCFSFMNRF